MATEKININVNGVLSFPRLRPGDEDDYKGDKRFKWSCQLYIPKTDTKNIGIVINGIQAAIEQKWPNAASRPRNIDKDSIWKDGDTLIVAKTGLPNTFTAGHWVFNNLKQYKASGRPPALLCYKGDEFVKVPDNAEIYAGMNVCVNVTLDAFDNKSTGVSAYLNSVIFINKGKRFGLTEEEKEGMAIERAKASQINMEEVESMFEDEIPVDGIV